VKLLCIAANRRKIGTNRLKAGGKKAKPRKNDASIKMLMLYRKPYMHLHPLHIVTFMGEKS